MIVSIIVAMAENGVIGKDNDLPWRLPADLKHFKQTTTGHSIIMGRKTYESIGRPLPKRRNIVITRNAEWKAEGVEVANSLAAALEMCREEKEVFVIGGGSIYALAFEENLVDKAYVTLVHEEFEGDTYFELPDKAAWVVTEEELHQPDEKNAYSYSFITFSKIES